MPHPEMEHGLRVQLATALRERDVARRQAAEWQKTAYTTREDRDAKESERDAAQANTQKWLSVVEQLRENLNATLLERDDLKEALAAARRENANLKATITAMLADLDIGGVLELDSGSMANARAALASPAAGEDG